MSSNRKTSAMSPVTSRPIETAGRNWLPRVVAKETISEAPNIRAVKRTMCCKCSAYRSARSEAGPVTLPVAMFHQHSGHTGSSEAMRRHLGQIRMAICIIAYFVDRTDRKVYPKWRSTAVGGGGRRHGTTRSQRAAHSKARGDPAGGQGHVHGAGPRRSAHGDRGTRPLGGRRHARARSEEHTSELQSPYDLVCRLLLEKKKKKKKKQKTETTRQHRQQPHSANLLVSE